MKAVISLSPDNLPKEISVLKRTDMGIVKMRKEGERKRRSIRMSERGTPLVTIISMSFRILSIKRMMVKTIMPMRKTGRISLRI